MAARHAEHINGYGWVAPSIPSVSRLGRIGDCGGPAPALDKGSRRGGCARHLSDNDHREPRRCRNGSRRTWRAAPTNGRWHRGTLLLALIGMLVLAAGLIVYDHCPQARSFHCGHQATAPIDRQKAAPIQTVLPFTGLSGPTGAAGNVYVADTGNNRVVKLAPESSAHVGVEP